MDITAIQVYATIENKLMFSQDNIFKKNKRNIFFVKILRYTFKFKFVYSL